MIIVIHGDDIAASRNKLSEYLVAFPFATRFDGKKNEPSEVVLSFEEQGLFESKRLIVIENFASILAEISPKLTKYARDSNTTIVLWQGALLDRKSAEKIKSAQVLLFALPKHFYPFLDGLYPRNHMRLHDLLTVLTQESSAEQIFYTAIKRIRALLMLKAGRVADFKELRLMSSWQVKKLQMQAALWSDRELISFYKVLFNAEFMMKTSTLPMPLIQHLDFLLLSEL